MPSATCRNASPMGERPAAFDHRTEPLEENADPTAAPEPVSVRPVPLVGG